MAGRKAPKATVDRTTSETLAESIGDHWEDLRELPWKSARTLLIATLLPHVRDALEAARTEGYLDGHDVGFSLGYADGVVNCDREHTESYLKS